MRLRGSKPEGLRAEDFRLTAPSGFGDGYNNYAHSMAWFRGRLFVGTTRAAFAMIGATSPLPDLKPWPVHCPADLYDVDRRAEIWRYTPESDLWERIYRAPWSEGRNQRLVPRYVGYRGMTVHQAPGDPHPCIYVSTWAPIMTEPPDILRSEDGEQFHSVPRPPWDESVRSFRTLQPFKGRLHTTPTGSNPGITAQAQESVSSTSVIYAADDLRSGEWHAASEDGFGNLANVTVFEMGTFNDHLYAGTVNPFTGFELWKTDGEGGPPYRWKRVLQRGAYRGVHNEVLGAMCAFNGALYVCSGVANGGYHRRFDIGPAASELIRVWPDDSWELLIGNARITPEGAKVPLSGYSPGFDNLFTGYFWRMCVHDGWLYMGTLNWANMLPYLPTHVWPEDTLVQLHRWGTEQVNRHFGGFGLWRSPDGLRWEPVTRSGFGNKYNWGVRTFASSPHGLFVGTANVFGPMMAMERESGWEYAANPRGGCEIYLGRHAAAADHRAA